MRAWEEEALYVPMAGWVLDFDGLVVMIHGVLPVSPLLLYLRAFVRFSRSIRIQFTPATPLTHKELKIIHMQRPGQGTSLLSAPSFTLCCTPRPSLPLRAEFWLRSTESERSRVRVGLPFLRIER